MLSGQAEHHYRGTQGERYQKEKRAIPPSTLAWVARTRAEKLAAFVLPTDVVLEYGAGFGWNLFHLECKKKLAHDLEDFLLPEIRTAGVEFVADTQSIETGTIDVILCHHALEHLMDPADALAEMGRLLRRDGKLLLFVPFEWEGRYQRFNPAEPNHHLFSWNAQTLGNLVTETGFQVADAGTGPFGYDRFAAAWASKLRIGETGFRAIRSLLQLTMRTREVRVVAHPSKSDL